MSVNAERAQIEEEEDDKEGGSVREQDRFLPIANISRIMKKALPSNAKIAKDAKETVQECVSEFISFITSEASDKCQREKRKTINGEDLLGDDDARFRRLRRAAQALLAKVQGGRGP